MSKRFIMSTTNSIEGCPIKKYIDVISTNIVIGTNVFSDFAASFTDFFGGRSGTYKRKMEIIYGEACKELKQKALSLGANAIVGFRVDFDEVSGKDKSMFMVSVTGTACVIESRDDLFDEEVNGGLISQADLEKEMDRRYVITQINNGLYIREEWMEFLLENPQVEVIDALINKYIDYGKNSEENKSETEVIERLLSVYPKEILVPKVYSQYPSVGYPVARLIASCALFDAKSILELCDKNSYLAIDILSSGSDFYGEKELALMKQILDKLLHLPDTGKIEVVKGGLLGKEQQKFICQSGHRSDPQSEFCENCGLNIKGLNRRSVEIIEQFRDKVEALDALTKK